jgi:fused signal recognition particle receptor
MDEIFIAEAFAIVSILGGGIWWLLSSGSHKNSSEVTKEEKEPTRLEASVSKPKKSKESIFTRIKNPFRGLLTKDIDEDILERLEESLVMADVGVETTEKLLTILKSKVRSDASLSELNKALRLEVINRLGSASPLREQVSGPLVILVVGVNGSGKTTTIGKLAHRYKQEGKRVLVAAGDTFRAGAVAQLNEWAKRANVEIVKAQPKADPASVFYSALESAKSKQYDVLICDTAGRLQEHTALMEELKKMVRVGQKVISDAPHEVLLVLDSTIGQNALSQAKGFGAVAPLTGVVLTKLDGTAKGGIVIAVRDVTGVPIKLVGMGEGIDDLHDFDPKSFVNALLREEDE